MNINSDPADFSSSFYSALVRLAEIQQSFFLPKLSRSDIFFCSCVKQFWDINFSNSPLLSPPPQKKKNTPAGLILDSNDLIRFI